ncbi:MAG: threonine synthase [Solirubrobacteraceae bacterium]
MTTLGEGGTPVIELPRLAAELGVGALHAKLESTNPTGSYKDRIAARSMDTALARGARGWITTSSGNGGTAFAAYGRRAGLPGFLCVTESITREKLLPALALGAEVVRVAGLGHGTGRSTERGLFETVQELAEEHQLYLGVTAHRFNDAGMRAVDEISREVLAAGVAPDVAYVPTGGGGLVSAVARGFCEAGAETAVVACQPAGCAPIARCLEGRLDVPRIERNASRISGLQLPSPPDGDLAVELVRSTGGWGVAVDDDHILEGQRALALVEGVFVEPAAACALAALRSDVRTGVVGRSSTALLVLTGSGLKDLATLEANLTKPPLTRVDDVRELVGQWLGRAEERGQLRA